MNENEMVQGDEISLFDLWEKLRGGWKSIAGGLVLGISGAVATIVLTPPKYEASATVQIGKVAGADIEAPEIVVQRVRQPGFLIAVAEADGDAQWSQNLRESALADKVVTASVVKGTQLVSFVVAANTPDQAFSRANLVIDRLKDAHEEIRAPLMRKIQMDMEVAKEKLKTAELELAELSQVGGTVTGKQKSSEIRDSQFAPISLLTSMRIQKQGEIFSIRQQLVTAENSLLSPVTMPTQPIEAVFVSTKPASPKKGLLLALGVLIGFLAGIVFVFGRDAWRSAAAKKNSQALAG